MGDDRIAESLSNLSESERKIAELAIRMRDNSTKIVDSALSLAREALRARPSSSTALRVVRPGEPLPEGELTGRFSALKSV